MTYHAANGTALSYGNWREGLPRVQCDGCAFVRFGVRQDGLPRAWLTRGKAPPGWLRVGSERHIDRENPRTEVVVRRLEASNG